LVLVSLSFQPKADVITLLKKLNENKHKQEPSNFYSVPTDEQKEKMELMEDERNFLTFQATKELMDKIALTKKILMLCASMPDNRSYRMETFNRQNTEFVRIHVNQSNLVDLSVGLHDTL